jgi:VanZ family protein
MKTLHFSFAGLALMAVLVVVIALTTLPDDGLIDVVRNFKLIEGHPNASDAIGHGALYGTLTAVTYWALRRRIGFSGAFPVAVGLSLALGIITEIIQHFSPGRTMALSDLLGNWLGVMTVAAVIGYTRAVRG